MIAYMQKWITTQILSVDPLEGQNEANRLIKKIYDNFMMDSGEKKRLFSNYYNEKKQGETYRRAYIMDHLRYDGCILFGSLGITSEQMDGMVRERDIVTLEESKVIPSGPTKKFEYYTYFGIWPDKKQLLVLKNGDMPEHVHSLIAGICFQAIESEPYRFDIETYQETTIRERIKELNKSQIELRIALSDLELMNKASFKQLKAKADRKGVAYVTMKLHFDTRLEEDVVDDLLDLGDDADMKRLIVKDADAPSKDADAIDLLKDVMKVKRDVKISKKDFENVDFVWEKFIEAMQKPNGSEGQ